MDAAEGVPAAPRKVALHLAAAQSPDAFDVWHSALSHMFDDSALTSAGAELFLTPRWTLLANSTASSLTVRRPTPAPAMGLVSGWNS